MVTLRFLQTVGMGSPDSTLHKSSPSIAKTLPMAEIPALCITLVESALQHARQSCPVLLALEGDALLFTTPKGQELHLVHLASDLRTRLEQAWSLGCGCAADIQLYSEPASDWLAEVSDQNW
ncbi:hypothetical protein QBZ16_005237 [Prototheca wickerhamii]|uniref:Uncharacterized protein n=1 Tax=Prototheca wickerhamii TaxID=3111 RepID=A0AAD9MGI7_PROWI|nr:hypothetical protein QBZ16_005237 [Prototheca wickerhamii]